MDTHTEPSGKMRGLALEMGGLHALVDCGCGAVIYAEVAAGRMPHEVLVLFVLTYNLLAFGLQWVLGWLSDLRGAYRAAAAWGACLVAAAVLVRPSSPWGAAALAGFGNAAFHVGVAGALLPRASERALEAGLFVGPGALGIFSGVWLGAHVIEWDVFMFPLLVGAGARLWFRIPPKTPVLASYKPRSVAALAVVFGALLLSTVIRSGVAAVVVGHWRSSAIAGLLLAIAACGGKCLGGWVADWFGWQRTGTVALVASAPLIVAGMHSLALGVCGLLLFQMTMAVTLVGMYRAVPRWPALAFGLPSLALVVGTLPDFIPPLQLEESLIRSLMGPVILVSAALLWIGLGWCKRLQVEDAEPVSAADVEFAEASRIDESNAALRRCETAQK
jgi:FSR family fosmidomycin resistance protein-like MFS transporter